MVSIQRPEYGGGEFISTANYSARRRILLKQLQSCRGVSSGALRPIPTASDSEPGTKRHRGQGRRALWHRSYDSSGVVPTASSSNISPPPVPVSRPLAISKTGASSMALGSAPANCTETCLEVELRTTAVISKFDENSTFAISKSAVTCAWACPCSDGASWTPAAASELETGCKAVLPSNEGDAMATGCCR